MNAPRVLGIGCLSCTAMLVDDPGQSLNDIAMFLAALGSPRRDGFSVSCFVEHPDNLDCLIKAEIFQVIDDKYFMDFIRLRGDSLRVAHANRDYRV